MFYLKLSWTLLLWCHLRISLIAFVIWLIKLHVNPQKIYKTLKVVWELFIIFKYLFEIYPQNINYQKNRPSNYCLGSSWWSSGWDSMLSMQGAWIWSLIRELGPPYVIRNTSFAATKTWHNQIKKQNPD